MPKYILPPPGKEKEKPVPVETYDEWRRRVTIPVNKEILEALEVGASATVTLTSKVVGLSDNEREGEQSNRSVDLLIKSVEVPSTNVFEQLSEDD